MSQPININTASLEQLKQISGISDRRAQKIINKREEKGSPLILEDLKLMTDIPNTMWDPLMKTGVIILEPSEEIQEGIQEDITGKAEENAKEIKKMAAMIEKLKTSFSNAEKDKALMKADYEHRIAAVNQDFTVKMKNREHDYEQQYDKLAKRHKEEMEELIDKVNERELKLNQSIEERDEQIKKIQMTMKTETDDKTKLQEMIEKWSLPKEKPSMKIAETKDEPSWKTKTNTHTGQGSKRQDGPLPPKMSTYDGRSDWRPYLVQFNHIANRYNWTNQDRLDKLIECLRDRALKFFTTMPKSVQEGYQAVCKKMEDRFGRKDLPHVIRRQLQDLRQLPEEPLDECMDKKAALTAMDKDPDSLDKALKYVKSAVTNQKVILGNKKPEVKRVTFHETETDVYDSHGDHESTSVRALYRKGASDTDVISRFESRLKKTEEDVQDTKSSIKQILDILKRGNSTNRFGQPQRLSSPWRSPIRDNKCFNCGDTGRPPTLSLDKQTEVNLYKTNIQDSDAKTLYIPVGVNSKKTFGVIDTAAQVSVISKTFFDQLTYKPKIKGNIILKGAGACSEINAGIAENVNLDIGSSTVKWDMVVAEITDNLILGIDFLESQKAIIDLTDYSIKLKGEKVPSFMTSNRQDQQMKIYRIKIKKKTVIPPGSSKVAIVELDEKPMNDIVIQPTNFMKGLLVPNMLCMGKKQVPVMLRNPTEQFKTLKKDFQMGIGLEINAVMEETDENSLKLNKIDITPKQSFGLNQLREKLPTHLKELFNRSLANLNNQQSLQLVTLLLKFQDIFAKDDLDIGLFNGDIQHKIDTGNSHPIKQKMRRTPLGFEKEEEEHLQQLLDKGIIEPSTSEWASPPVLVRKKDGKLRYCIDFRKLNDVTIKDAFPISNIDTCLDTLKGTVFMSTLDMASGYYQVNLDEKDRHKTAFVTKYGLFQYTKLPFGLCNSPATFSRVIQLVLQGLTWKECLAYLDDVIVLGKDFDDHICSLSEVFSRFQKYNLKLKPSKCQLLQTQVKFLGKIVSADGVAVNPDSIGSVKKWPTPKEQKKK
ncbi:Hypothetical predicted protein [Mytilus galloprovincialis]|uniref:Reverse transcriptase domain-containing protein n=1 Tax=Mytilus galloprovincialis TaxID=29158 RepID=A0A8B6E5W1_MYTGA|nr:Hypothetical predicted protein [Mytilus galloprovincialis]